jgi:hypothetical protein
MGKQMNIKKLENNIIQIDFKISNNKLNMVQLVDTSIIDIIHSVQRGEFIEDYKLSREGEGEFQSLQIIFCHLFSDIGIPQFFLNMDIHKIKDDENVLLFDCVKNKVSKPLEGVNMSRHVKSSPIENINVKCVFPDAYTCVFTVFIKHNTPPEMIKFEPMILTMFKKVFKSVKMLIENLS